VSLIIVAVTLTLASCNSGAENLSAIHIPDSLANSPVDTARANRNFRNILQTKVDEYYPEQNFYGGFACGTYLLNNWVDSIPEIDFRVFIKEIKLEFKFPDSLLQRKDSTVKNNLFDSTLQFPNVLNVQVSDTIP
jgi:hypothetical protein